MAILTQDASGSTQSGSHEETALSSSASTSRALVPAAVGNCEVTCVVRDLSSANQGAAASSAATSRKKEATEANWMYKRRVCPYSHTVWVFSFFFLFLISINFNPKKCLL